MKKILILIACIMTFMSIDAQTIQVYKDGKLVATYDESNVDEVTFAATSVTFKSKESTVVYNDQDIDEVNFKEEPVVEYVDLGLSVKWATCNIGAKKPEQYGYYYAWGEVEPKSDYQWSNYKWCDGTDQYMTKYCFFANEGKVDRIKELETDDDVAYQTLGNHWRIPTKAEMDELLSCEWRWTNINGINGYQVMSRIDSEKYIFLPASGFIGTQGNPWENQMGRYWTNTVSSAAYCHTAYSFYFSSSDHNWRYDSRCMGINIRPVYVDEEIPPTPKLEIDTEALTFENSDVSTTLTTRSKSAKVSANGAWTVSVPEDCRTWLSATANGNSDGMIRVSMNSINTRLADRTAVLTITSGDIVRKITVTQKGNTGGVENGHEYIDMGLGLGWANYNIGEEPYVQGTPHTDFGLYFQWAVPFGINSRQRPYPEYPLGEFPGYEFYNTVDGKTILEPQDDPANRTWEGKWRTPTHDEMELLLTKNCQEQEWIFDEEHGKGYMLKSGVNGNIIFLPAAGYADTGTFVGTGGGGRYWTSQITNKGSQYAYSLEFSMNDKPKILNRQRNHYYTVRGVVTLK